MKKLYEYIDSITKDDIYEYIDDMEYDDHIFDTLYDGIQELKTMKPTYNDNVIFSLYSDMLFIQPIQEQSVHTKKEEKVFFIPYYFMQNLDITKQYPLQQLSLSQALGAYVVLDQDYSATHMILLIIDTLFYDEGSLQAIKHHLQEMIDDIHKQFPTAVVSTVAVQSSDQVSQNDLQNFKSQIFEQQVTINKAFEQKIKDSYQYIMYN